MVKYVLKNGQSYKITDDLYEQLLKNGYKMISEGIILSDDEVVEYKRQLYDYAWGKLKEKAGFDVDTINELIDMEEQKAIQSEINKLITPDVFKDISNVRNIYKELYKQAVKIADTSMNRLQDKRNKENQQKEQDKKQGELFDKNSMELTHNPEDFKADDNQEFDNDIDIESDKRLIFVKNALATNNIPLTDEQFQDMVGKDKINSLIDDVYNTLYYCGNSKSEAKNKIALLKDRYKNPEEFAQERDEQTQELFNQVTKKWFNSIYDDMKENKPNVANQLNKFMSSSKRQDEDYDLKQEFSIKAKTANDIIKRIQEIMLNVGKVNYVNYVFTEVPNLSTVKKYYLSNMQDVASYSADREIQLAKIQEIRDADNNLFKDISKRLLVHGDIQEYLKIIRYDDVLDGLFTVARSERATTLGHEKVVLTFTEDSSKELMFILVIEPSFGTLKQFFKGLDLNKIKSAYNDFHNKM